MDFLVLLLFLGLFSFFFSKMEMGRESGGLLGSLILWLDYAVLDVFDWKVVGFGVYFGRYYSGYIPR